MAEDGDALAVVPEQLATRRVVWLLPEPVRTAQIAATGFDDAIIVSCGERSLKLAPAASAREPMCITCSCVTSEYAKTTSSTSCSRISSSSSASGWIGIPSG